MSEELRLVWSASALLDLEGIVEFVVLRDGLLAAEHVHDLVVSATDRLTSLPKRCRIVPELKAVGVRDYRELLAGPYRICFRVHGADLVLVAILDGRRDLAEVLVDRALRG